MGREIRRVPLDWQHPIAEHGRDRGQYHPLYDQDVESAAATWFAEWERWKRGENEYQEDDPNYPDRPGTSYRECCEWIGQPPDPDYYRARTWTEEEATAYQVYENVTEGTPVSPVLPDEESVVAWLVQHGHSEHAAREFVRSGWAPSGVIVGSVMATDVDAFDIMPPRKD